MFPTKEDMERIEAKSAELKKDFKNRALMVIETLVGEDIIWDDIDKLKSDIYKIAHAALGDCTNEHLDWRDETEKQFRAFEEAGLI
jgi:hypothetical protein